MVRPPGLLLELGGRPERPGGIAKELPSEGDEVGLPGTEDVVGLLRRGDHPDRARGYSGLGAYPLGEGTLVAGTDRHSGGRYGSTGGAVDEVDANTIVLPEWKFTEASRGNRTDADTTVLVTTTDRRRAARTLKNYVRLVEWAG